MAKTETLNLEVKSNIKSVTKDTDKMADSLDDVNKEAKAGVGNFTLMGVSLNGVKNSFAKIIPTAKLMFGTIKAGLISTGIGAFLVAIGSLVSFFTNTKRGADKLATAFAGVGAAVDVITDRISRVGEILALVFEGKFREAGKLAKEVFSGMTEEIKNETAAMMALKKRTQELRDAENEFMIQKAATRQEIERARLTAEDETKSAKERLDNLKKALELEAETTKQELVLAKERMLIQKEEMQFSENLVEDEAKLAQLKVAFIETETASIKMRRRVVTEVNALEREIHAEKTARTKEEIDALKALQAADAKRYGDLIRLSGAAGKAADGIIQADNSVLDNYLSNNEKRKKSDEAMAASKLKMTSAIGQAVGSLSALMEEGSASAKATALAEIAINTGVGIVQGLDIAQKSAKAAGPAAAFAFPLFYASQIAAVLGAAAQAKTILGAGAGGGGGGSSVPSASSAPPAPQMMSGAFQLEGGQEVEPARAYVVSDDITANQNALAVIRRRATI